MSAKDFQQQAGGEGWRVLDGAPHAWFEAPSHSTGASLVERLAGSTDGFVLPDMDLRPTGIGVRLGGHGEPEARRAGAISTIARELGLAPDPSVLQVTGLAIDATDPEELVPFWRTVFAYHEDGERRLSDPLRRDPAIVFHKDDEIRPLRNRLHIDVGRPPEEVASAVAELRQTPSGPYGLMVSDDAGNEVDLVPGGPISTAPEVADWRAPFAAMVFYPTPKVEHAAALVTRVAGLADDAAIPLLVDIRAEGVTIDSGKDLWEGEDGALPAFTDLASKIQAYARDLGLAADPARVRFMQVALDLVDLPSVREFWKSVLGYEPDPREGVVDLFDPRRLNPVLIFQRMDESDEDRRRQRDRIRLVLSVPDDQLQPRIDTAVAAGGKVLRSSDGLTRVSDPEGNELDLVGLSP
ncbi:MAG TPA: VOC family protein [Acidimicrobiia bacterium]|nr:VOC family protein [Acidimicrobiia bacterium]